MTDIKEVSGVPGVRDDSGLPIDKIVFGVAAGLSVAFVLVGAIWPDDTAEATNEAWAGSPVTSGGSSS